MEVNPKVRQRVDLSFQIVDRIYEILQAKGLRQKDLAQLLGKKEAEIKPVCILGESSQIYL